MSLRYAQQKFCSVTIFQIKLLCFQEKCNKCLNQSELKLMRGWGGGRGEARNLVFCATIAFYLLHALGSFYPWVLEGLLMKQDAPRSERLN